MVEVTVRTDGGAAVVALRGAGDAGVLARIAGAVAHLVREDDVRIVDVSDLALVDVTAVRAFLTELLARVDAWAVTLVCNRLTGRRILRRYGGDALTIVAGADALVPA